MRVSTSTKLLLKELKFYLKVKYINIRYFYIYNNIVAKGKIVVKYILRKDNIVDVLTKALPLDTLKQYKKIHRNTRSLS